MSKKQVNNLVLFIALFIMLLSCVTCLTILSNKPVTINSVVCGVDIVLCHIGFLSIVLPCLMED